MNEQRTEDVNSGAESATTHSSLCSSEPLCSSGSGGLSEKDEALLYRFYDNQLGVIDRFRVQLLLRRSPAAVAFLRQCRSDAVELQACWENEVGEALKAFSEEQAWQHIDARVAHSRQAELLGRRSAASPRWRVALGSASRKASLKGSAVGHIGERLRWGFSGATCGALASAVVMYLWVPQVPSANPNSFVGNIEGQRGSGIATSTIGSSGPDSQQIALLASPEAQQIDQALKYSGSNGSSTRMIGDLGAMGREDFNEAGRLTHNVALGGASSEYRRQDTGDNQYDLSRAIAAALAERARRESLNSQPLMSLAQDPRLSGSQSAIGGTTRRAEGPGSLFGRSPRAIEVDWMRSRGRVRMFHDPVEKTAYIWVKPSRGLSTRTSTLTRASSPERVGTGEAQFSNASSSVSSFH